MIEDLIMLSLGWGSGVATALLYRHFLNENKPIDPELLPEDVPMPRARSLEPVMRPDISPFAPKPKRVWRAPRQDRQTSWTGGKPQPPPPPKPPAQPPTPPPQPPGPVLSPGLLPPIPWGQKHTAAPGG